MWELMFDQLTAVRRQLKVFCRELEPDRLNGLEAAAAIESLVRIEKLAAGARLRLARRVDATVTDENGATDKADWLAKTTGQSPNDAKKDLETSEQLDRLDATDEALRDGELSPDQAHEVSAAATEDPSAELSLLDAAKTQSVPELKRKARKVKAAANDDAAKARKAHENRDLYGNTDDTTGEAWAHVKGPRAAMAQFWSYLEPWIQAEFDKARREGRHERRGAYAFDALLAALAFAASMRGGKPTLRQKPNVGPPVKIVARVDITAVRRGHTVAGEVCEIDGLGPVSVEDLLQLLPQAAIDLIVTDGVDVWNVTHLKRRANAWQQTVLDWFGGQCTRQGCGATRNLQVDHTIDWAKVHITQLRDLEWLCTPDHKRKTLEGWALVPGTGRRPMVPPDHPDHPRNRAGADPPQSDAA
jgi:hypothetical protein